MRSSRGSARSTANAGSQSCWSSRIRTRRSRLLIAPTCWSLAARSLSVVAGAAAQAQEILLGNLFAGAGPFATLARTNEIAAQMAVDEINAAGGVNGKK